MSHRTGRATSISRWCCDVAMLLVSCGCGVAVATLVWLWQFHGKSMWTSAPLDITEHLSAIFTIVAVAGVALHARRNVSLILLSLGLGYFVGVISAPQCSETADTTLDHIVQLRISRFPVVFECCTTAFAGVAVSATLRVMQREVTG